MAPQGEVDRHLATPLVRLGSGGEFDLIRSLLGERPELPPGVRVGPGDDCAVLEGGLTLSCDLSVEDVHFRRDWMTPHEIGYRATAAALSDLAAVAARPLGVLVAYGLPRQDGRELAVGLHRGVEEACRRVGAAVIGGDVTASPGALVIDVTVVGHTDRPVLRSGARPGDEVWVTGRLGAAAVAVRALEGGRPLSEALRQAFVRPTPRTAEALWLAERADLHALIDLSDGLAGDAGHLAAASGATLVLAAAAIPCGREVPPPPDALVALSGGEDYELCLVVPAGGLERLARGFRSEFGVDLTRVGRVEGAGPVPVVLETQDGVRRALRSGGFDHFPPEGA